MTMDDNYNDTGADVDAIIQIAEEDRLHSDPEYAAMTKRIRDLESVLARVAHEWAELLGYDDLAEMTWHPTERDHILLHEIALLIGNGLSRSEMQEAAR